MYNPYQNQQQHSQYAQQYPNQQGVQTGLHHPQPQHAPQGQQYYPQQQGHQQAHGGQDSLGNLFADPATSMAAQFAKNSFGQLNSYIQQNFGTFIPGTSDIKYYFKVSNSYVLRKIGLVLFPYRHLNWNRIPSGHQNATDPATGVPVANQNSVSGKYLPPTHDVNAPDLYVPLMAFVTYILLWSVFQGLKGDFHPQLFASLALLVFACSIVDILIFRAGLYFLNATDFLFWDVVAYSSYKYVSVIMLLCARELTSNSWLYTVFLLLNVANFGLFLMRSLRAMILPSGYDHSNSITTSQRRIRLQLLFAYAVILQAILIWYMSS